MATMPLTWQPRWRESAAGLGIAAVWLAYNLASWSDLYGVLPPLGHPLALGLLLLLGPPLGTGILAGRWSAWWLVPLAFAPWLAASLSGWPQDRFNEPLIVPSWTVPIAFLVLLAGRPLRRLLRRAAVPAGLLLALAFAPWAAWAVLRQVDPLDRRPAHPRLVDLDEASFGGVRIGDPSSLVLQRLGPPPVAPEDGSVMPLLPSSWEAVSPPDRGTLAGDVSWRYRHVAVVLHHGRVVSLAITDPDAQTSAGVGIGDNVEIARRAYPTLRCQTGSTLLLYCAGSTSSGAEVWFGPDPIGSITFTAR